MIRIDRTSDTPLHRQLYRAIRDRILAGDYPAGIKLPPTRELAAESGVSRATAVEAYEQLAAEGYVEPRVGDGSYVAPGSSIGRSGDTSLNRGSVYSSHENALGFPAGHAAVDSVGSRLLGFRGDLIDFRTGLPDLSSFPIQQWRRLTREAIERLSPKELAYGRPEGIPELRQAISRYLVARRGVRCVPEQIVVLAGTTQAVGLITRLLCRLRENLVVLEDPITADIRHIVGNNGGESLPVTVDDLGLRTDLLPKVNSVAFIYVTPSHHFPLGGIMPIQRRIELIDYANLHGSYIVEDDYDTEFRYTGNPISSLQELAPERVLYVGSFSKTVFPALRLAFIVLPPLLVEEARRQKWYTDLHNPIVEQKTLAAFISEGYFERHIQRTKRKLAARHRTTRELLKETFGYRVTIRGAAAGLHLAASFAGIQFDAEIVAKAEAAGVAIYPANIHAHNGTD